MASPPSALADLADDHASRNAFLRMVGGGAAAAGLATLLAACGGEDPNETGKVETVSRGTGRGSGKSDATPEEGGDDVEILNYALKLEHLETAFYQEAEETGLIKDKRALELLKAFGETEATHVETLKATVKKLGGTPVSKPTTRFELVFEGGAEMILQSAATIENLGAAAYLGQAPRIKSKDILAAALSIHSVEARHAAALNALLRRGFEGGGPLSGAIPDGAFAKPMSMTEVLAAAKPFLVS